ncbi:MAG: diguanylate cyclase [Nitrospirae bacterium]|nr:diguanylate cyclase [Nitrospirota bacterium]
MSLVGRLEDLALPDIFQIISLSKKTGTLVVRSRKGSGMIVFKNGQVVQAGSDVIRDSLGNILVSQGMVDQADLAAALARQKMSPDKPLGMILVETKATTAQVIEDVVRQQIEEIIYDLLAWEEGFFNFELGEVVPKDKIEVDTQDLLLKSGLSAEYLLMEGTRILDEKRKGQGRKTSPAAKPQATPKASSPPDPFAEEAPPPSSVLSRPAPVTRTSSKPAREEFRSKIENESPSKQITTLKSMFDELRFPTATAEVTLLTLRYASEVVNRAILFMVKKDEVRGLGQFGIELASGASPDKVVRNIRIPLNTPSLFRNVIESRRTYLGPMESNDQNNYFVNEVGGSRPDVVLALPLVVDNKVALIVYGDNLPDLKSIRGVETLEIFMNQAGMALEKALLERKLAELEKEKK